MAESHSRHIKLEQVINFRDLGGYRTREGRTVAWRRLFRSGEFPNINETDLNRLTGEIGLTSVLDLRSDMEIKQRGIGPLSEAGIRYHSVPFITSSASREEEERRFLEFTNMGEFYLHFTRDGIFGKRIIAALEIIAEPANHPLVFHCAVGKDRTGILAAVLLNILGVEDETIIEDYSLSGPYMQKLLEQIKNMPETPEFINNLPDFFWEAAPASMALFLSTLRQEYGSIKGYLETQDIEPSLVNRLERALLT